MFATAIKNDLASLRATEARLHARLVERFGDSEGTIPVRALAFIVDGCLAEGRTGDLASACEVGGLLLDLDLDPHTVAAAMIGSAIPATRLEHDSLAAAFGPEVLDLLRGLQRAGRIEAMLSGEVATEGLRKMFLAIAEDVRVVLIKLAERTCLMRALTRDDRVDAAARHAAARQTRDLFAPLANRLGVFQIKWELEDLAFRFLDPELYREIAGLIDGKRADRERYIENVICILEKELAPIGLAARISGRPKHLWSIHRKMQRKAVGINELYDIRAVRVLTDSVRDCYTVLGIVHDLWQPVPGEFDDYIANPKHNNYRSLHTAVMGPDGKTLEVQIRTHAMHAESEHGMAAHWRYKETGTSRKSSDKFDAKIAWLRQVLEWRRDLEQAESGSHALVAGQTLLDDTIFVLTPQGRVVDLPKGATPIDFAYHLHTDLGHRCRGAKVDGQIVPLNTPLMNAQQVEIITAKVGGPSRDWLNRELHFLASHRALSKVRQWFNKQSFEQDLATGRAILEKELQRAGQTAMKHDAVALQLGYPKVDDFLAALGRGDVTGHQIELTLKPRSEPPPPVEGRTLLPDAAGASGVLVLGVDNLATLLAQCCKPVPPDSIIGFVTRTRGVLIHRRDCHNVAQLTPDQRERLMLADWGNDTMQSQVARFSADIEVTASDRQGLLRDVTDAIAREKVNVTAVKSVTRGTLACMRFTIQITSVGIIERVRRSVLEVKGVDSVVRR